MFYEFQHFGISEYVKKEYGKDFVFPSHLHHAFEFITVTDGTMDVLVDETKYSLQKDESLLIFPNQIHSLLGKGSSHMLCIFSADLVKAYSTNVADKLPQSNFFVPDKQLTDALDKLAEDASLAEKKGLFYCLCAAFDKSAVYVSGKGKDKKLMHDIFRFVEDNYNKECSLKKLSAETGFSYSYLSRYFKKTTGISFNSYVNRYRIGNACYLLKNTDCTVLRCALDSGYDSLRSFNRNFKEQVLVSPNDYRKDVINKV